MSKGSIQRVRRLGRHARARREEGAFVVEGPRAISAALDFDADLDEVLYLADRVIVITRGMISEAPPGASRSEIGAMMLRAEREA